MAIGQRFWDYGDDLASTSSAAVAALNTASEAQQYATMRKAKIKALETAAFTSEAIFWSISLAGTSMAASLVRFERASLRTCWDTPSVDNSCSRSIANAFTITMPNTATASSPATRATALLMPEAAPARS